MQRSITLALRFRRVNPGCTPRTRQSVTLTELGRESSSVCLERNPVEILSKKLLINSTISSEDSQWKG